MSLTWNTSNKAVSIYSIKGSPKINGFLDLNTYSITFAISGTLYYCFLNIGIFNSY